MASFIYTVNDDGDYVGKGSKFGNPITVIAKSFIALYKFFFGKSDETE